MSDKAQFSTPNDLANAVKTKYPEYKTIPNLELAQKVLAKYPEYWQSVDAVNFAREGLWQPASTGTHPTPVLQTGESSLGKFMDKANQTVLDLLPAAGATVGGIIGAPGIVTGAAGAGAGAGLGQLTKEKIEEVEGISQKPTATQELKNLGGAVAAGTASDIGSGLLAKGVQKGASFVASQADKAADSVMGRIIGRATTGTGTKSPYLYGTQKDINSEVSKVARSSMTLKSLRDKVVGAVQDLTNQTEQMIARRADPNVKVPLHDILIRSGADDLDNVNAASLSDKGQIIDKIIENIRTKAGADELAPTDALKIRRWIHSPEADQMFSQVKGFRKSIYHGINDAIDKSLSRPDSMIFRANNRTVSRLLKAQNAIDRSQLGKATRRLAVPVLHGGIGGWTGYEIGGRKGAIIGALAGSALSTEVGTTAFDLGTAAASRGISKAAAKVATGASSSVARRGAQALLMHGLQPKRKRPRQ